MKYTTAELLDIWNERAAIREHEGGQSVEQAEFNAAKDVERIVGEMPDVVREAVQRNRNERQGAASVAG